MKIFRKNNFLYIAAFIFITFFLYSNIAYSAAGSSSGSSSSGGTDKVNLYKDGKKLVYRAKKLEKKGKFEKAEKLYLRAYKKFEKAYSKDKKNPDILNYLGFTLRKTGKLKEAEKYYLAGLKIKPNHNGINEYLGELYVKTGRIELAKERLAVLKNCNCKEFNELKEVIEKN